MGSKWPMFLKWLTWKPPYSEKATQLPTLPAWPRRRARRSVNTGDGSSLWRSRLQTSPLVALGSGELSFWKVTIKNFFWCQKFFLNVDKLYSILKKYLLVLKNCLGMGRLPPRKMPSLNPLRQPTWTSVHILLHKLIQASLLWRFYNLIYFPCRWKLMLILYW